MQVASKSSNFKTLTPLHQVAIPLDLQRPSAAPCMPRSHATLNCTGSWKTHLEVEDEQESELQTQRPHGGARRGAESVQQVCETLCQARALATAAAAQVAGLEEDTRAICTMQPVT